MRVESLSSWDAFKSVIGRICADPLYIPENHFFRGIKDANWELIPTLDRWKSFKNPSERADSENLLLKQFRSELLRLGNPSSEVPTGDALALLARHHGLPSSWIDWSTSPYIAAYFAFSGAISGSVSIWYQPRAWLPDKFATEDLIDDPDLLRFNPRALRQRGIFLRSKEDKQALARQLDLGLIKFVLPISAKNIALEELDSMTINATNLFADYDGAARTATDRLSRRMI